MRNHPIRFMRSPTFVALLAVLTVLTLVLLGTR